MELVRRFLDFLDRSPTPYHAVENAARALHAAGFVELQEGSAPFPLPPGHRGYVRRSGTLIAFRMGSAPMEEAGFRVVSAHTDSPNLRIKPQPITRTQGYVRLGVEVYGGVILATWTDRDLGLAGQVFVRGASDGAPARRALVDIRRPLCRIPNLAIHLNRQVNEEGLKLNAQTQLQAVLTLDPTGSKAGDKSDDPLRALLAAEIGCGAADILSWDLMLFDLTTPTIGGLNDEFLFSARLDNLGSSHAALEAMLATGPGAATAVVALHDHEEIGSHTARGASGRLLEGVLTRLLRDSEADAALPRRGGLERAVAHSWHLSADMAHAVHPAWSDKHDPDHMPRLNHGPVIKQNASQRYGTEGETSAHALQLCGDDLPYQWFVNRSDLACGSTVGPLVAAQLALRTVDVGNPMLSMHSAREMCGTHDQDPMVRLMTRFLER
jgi:aspartyl aminopeptidase